MACGDVGFLLDADLKQAGALGSERGPSRRASGREDAVLLLMGSLRAGVVLRSWTCYERMFERAPL